MDLTVSVNPQTLKLASTTSLNNLFQHTTARQLQFETWTGNS